MRMKHFCLRFAGVVLAVIGMVSQGSADDIAFVNGGGFDSGANWSDGKLPGDVPGDVHFVQDGLIATLFSGSVTMGKLIVSDGSHGELAISGANLTVGGGNESFVIGRSVNGEGYVTLLEGAQLVTAANDSSIVGQRSRGGLTIVAGASVESPGSVWRVGQYGPSIDNGLAGDGMIDVFGTFNAHVMYLGVDDGRGMLIVHSGGMFTLSGNLQPGVNTDYPNRSCLVYLDGSNAQLVAQNLESFNQASEIKNQYLFAADSGGVSTVTLRDAVNIGNNRLSLDLTNYALAPGEILTLFDAAPNRIFGTFTEVEAVGLAANEYRIEYNQTLGDIQLIGMEPGGVLGDANGDGSFDFGDIEAFFLAVTDLPAFMAQYPNVAILLLDMNDDGNTDFGDIEAFFTALTGG